MDCARWIDIAVVFVRGEVIPATVSRDLTAVEFNMAARSLAICGSYQLQLLKNGECYERTVRSGARDVLMRRTTRVMNGAPGSAHVCLNSVLLFLEV